MSRVSSGAISLETMEGALRGGLPQAGGSPMGAPMGVGLGARPRSFGR